MTGTLICNYICSQKAKLGTLPKNGALVSTIVSSEMTKAIAKKYNLAYFDVLTGFKYIGEKIKEFEQTGDYQYVFGFEESYGCLSGTYARDKDAVVASLLICEMAAYYKSRGMSLYDGLMELYDTYGVYKEIIHSITLKGIEGIENMKKIMDTLRKDAPSEIAGVKVTETRDYLEDKIVDVASGKVSPTNLPKSNVLYYTLADDTWFCVRPSGTEPKIKIYFGTKADTVENAEKKIATAQDGIMKVNTDKFTSYTFHSKINAQLFPFLKVYNNTQYYDQTYRYTGKEGGANANFLNTTVHALPCYAPNNPDGTYTYNTLKNNYSIGDGMNAMLLDGKNGGSKGVHEFRTTCGGILDLGNYFKSNVDYTYQFYMADDWYRSAVGQYSIQPGILQDVPNYNVDQYKKTNWFDPMHVFNAYLNYNQTFGKHSVGATAGVNYETKKPEFKKNITM